MTNEDLMIRFLVNRALWSVSMWLLASLIASRKGFSVGLSGGFAAVAGVLFPPVAILQLIVMAIRPRTAEAVRLAAEELQIAERLRLAREDKTCPQCETRHSVVNRFCPSCMFRYPEGDAE
jgi:uncharacterized membrane protein YtjA (UPF0391 family)